MENKEKRKFLIDAKRAYKNTAKLCLQGNNAVLINTMTGCRHLFVDSSESIPLTSKEVRLNSDLFEKI